MFQNLIVFRYENIFVKYFMPRRKLKNWVSVIYPWLIFIGSEPLYPPCLFLIKLVTHSKFSFALYRQYTNTWSIIVLYLFMPLTQFLWRSFFLLHFLFWNTPLHTRKILTFWLHVYFFFSFHYYWWARSLINYNIGLDVVQQSHRSFN